MIGGLLKAVFGSTNDRIVKTLAKKVERINALEPEMEKLSDDALKAKTDEFKTLLSEGTSEDDILVEAFAVVREASKRVLGMRHFDVQLVGAMVLHSGKISEMRTGEGKTLVATLAVYLNALSGKGVHVVTVNDYLAARDARWMGQLYNWLGLTIGIVVPGMDDASRQASYNADITYTTNNELGFDYLRDNLKTSIEQMVQRDPNFVIVDEVDSILVDEARTPLIISGPAEDSSETYAAVDKLIPLMQEEHYEIDEKAKNITMTDEGTEFIEGVLRDQTDLLNDGNMYDVENVSIVHHVNQGLRAHKLFTKDVDYIVQNNKVVIIDEFTGRMMEGRRYGDGLHQAIEAKEGVQIQNENQTLASVTFQNYFRMYPKLAGMTGTAMTEAAEFEEIYNLPVVEIPTNKPTERKDYDDEVYRTSRERDNAVILQVKECVEKGQPVLVGTASIERSEELSALMKKAGIKHETLNARQHEREAHIIADAGIRGAVTLATNMAGRGTDIQLGGNLEMRLERELADIKDEAKRDKHTEEITAEIEAEKKLVLENGGLYVIGTERHESRRIDNQLRGRSGRQGDPGASKFYVSLEDDLMRIFGSDRMDGMLRKLGLEDGEAIIHPWVNKALEKAQQKVEARNFEVRKQLLKFDDVMNDQRKVIFEQRKDLMRAEDVSDTIADMRAEVLEDMVNRCMPAGSMHDQWDLDALHEECMRLFSMDIPVQEWGNEEGIANEEMLDRISTAVNKKMAEKAANYGPEIMRAAEKSFLLQILDHQWKDHLLQLDHLRQGIGLRAYAQRDPLNEYKQESFNLFENMLDKLREHVTQFLSHVEFRTEPTPEEAAAEQEQRQASASAAQVNQAGGTATAGGQASQYASLDEAPDGWVEHAATGRILDPENEETWGKVPRNAECPCGSGKKYKHCHGKA
ncbi:preprotein translocase subunit SecA [Curvivirga aplysinae]|uniref:preprotein translocase subunit SecA n=1 Tax=Curvivirga aplysinae TaxID=2529852 RepID=UPI0012BD26D4|nr:preprotein translocase subunit SecA [Curvivirga aplysinae]MTI11068.1 preprotein translocase subunit SecA [Curvivirga aplysinae]